MQVSLVMPTRNGGSLLDEVLRAIDRQPGADRLEKIAVDSGSEDGTPERLRRHGFDVQSIDPRDFDHGATRDLAIDRCSGDVVVLLTQDATPADERWLPSLVGCFDSPAVGAAYCRQLPRDDCNPFIAHRMREWTAGRTERVVQRVDDPAAFDAMAPLERLRVCAYDNVAGSVRKSAWQERRFGRCAFGEDVAFGKRLILAGHEIVFEPASCVVHSHNRSPREEGKRIYCDHQNLRRLFDVHLIPTLAGYRAAVRAGRAEFERTVDGLEVEPREKARLRKWARSYALWSALGQYLGGNSDRNMARPFGWIFRRIDRWMHAGI
jgi:rhamnosyltransferase